MSALISAKELAALRVREECALLDATWTYPGGPLPRAQGFIPGAVAFDLEAISDASSALPHMLPSPDAFEGHVRALGVREGRPIVVYDRVGLFTAPRAWWMFRAMGTEDVRVLDGGLPAWIGAGFEVWPESPAAVAEKRGDFAARPVSRLIANRSRVARTLEGEAVQLVDVRSAARYRGDEPEPRPGLRAGHVPGALNAPWSDLVDGAGRLKSADELRRILADAGLGLKSPVIAMCGSGVTACIAALAMNEIGFEDWSVYDGSWAEWGARPDLPVAAAEDEAS